MNKAILSNLSLIFGGLSWSILIINFIFLKLLIPPDQYSESILINGIYFILVSLFFISGVLPIIGFVLAIIEFIKKKQLGKKLLINIFLNLSYIILFLFIMYIFGSIG